MFGGIGACTAALKRLNIDFEVVDYVDIDKYATASYNAINGTSFETQDIRNWNKDIEADLIMHGSPCQDFSIAGKQAGGDEGTETRSSLMWETVRIIEKVRPKYVIWENVKNVIGKKHKHNFDKYINELDKLGYNSNYQILNAKDYGNIPQNRERVYTISIRKDIDTGTFKFPEKEELKLRLKDMLEDDVDEKYYLSEKIIAGFLKHNERHKEKGTGFIWKPKNENEIANTLRANASLCPTDNTIRCIQVAQMYGTEKEPNPQAGRIYDSEGISPTMDSCSGGNRMPKVMVNERKQ